MGKSELSEILALELLDRAKKLEEEAPNYDNRYVVRSLYNGATKLREIAQRSLTNRQVISTNRLLK